MLNSSDRTIIISSILLLLVISIPSVYSQTFDGETCLSLISAEQVQNISGYDQKLDARIINANLESANEGVTSGCVVTFEREGLDFGLTVVATASDSDRTAQSVYGDVFSASHQMGVEVIEGNNGPWIHHLIELNSNGIGSFLASIKDNIQVGLNAPQTNFSIEPSAMLEILKVVQSNVDELGSFTTEETSMDEQVICPQGMEPIDGKCPDKPVVQTTIEPTMISEKQISPKKQISQGIEPEAVKCNEGLVLVLKHTGTPACVKPDTAEKLYERNWGGMAAPCCKP